MSLKSGIEENDTNEFLHKAETDPQTQKTNLWLSKGKDRRENLGDEGSIPGSGRTEMATHSSIPAWEIPWTEEPGGLLSMGSQRVGHD